MNGAAPPSLDTPFAFVLIAGLLAVVGWDLRAYAMRRPDTTKSAVTSLTQPGELRIGGVELYRGEDSVVELENFGPVEYRQPHVFRHGYGPVSTILISSLRRHGRLSFMLQNNVAGQSITISRDGKVLEKLDGLPVGGVNRDYEFEVPETGNARFTFEYARYNHAGADIAPGDARAIAETFSAIDLSLQ